MFGLAHRAVLLAPAEDAFGHFAASLRDLVADVASRTRIDRTPAPLAGLGEAVVLRNMRRDVHPAQRRNVIAGVVGFVLADGDALLAFGSFLEHGLRSAPWGGAARLCNHAADGKAVPVLHERMAQVRELGLAPVRLAVELGFRVGRALMRIVLA